MADLSPRVLWVVRVWLWWRGDRVFICPECGKLWPRGRVLWGEKCGGTHNQPHPLRLMRRARVVGRMAPVERAAEALRWDAEWR